MLEEERAEYLAVFLSAALAALPTSVQLAVRYDVANVSTIASSYAMQRLHCHGMRVRPSGRRSEHGISPVGSFTAGTSARRRARQMMLINC